MILLKSIGFAILAPIGIFVLIYKEIAGYKIYSRFAEVLSYVSIVILCFSSFYSILAVISSIISILMILIWPLHYKIFSLINRI